MPLNNYPLFPLRLIRMIFDPCIDIFLDIIVPVTLKLMVLPYHYIFKQDAFFIPLNHEKLNNFNYSEPVEQLLFDFCNSGVVPTGMFSGWIELYKNRLCSLTLARGVGLIVGYTLVAFTFLLYLVFPLH